MEPLVLPVKVIQVVGNTGDYKATSWIILQQFNR